MRTRFRTLAMVIAVVQFAAVVAAPVVARRAVEPRWDQAIGDLVSFVEAARGRSFVRPVDIAYLGEDEFAGALADRSRDAHEDARARALGLATTDDHAPNRLSVSRYVGVYLPSTERIVVRGTAFTPFAQATVVHELTHALDDQHFDLRRLGGRRAATYGERLAHRAVVEASASLVEDAFVESLNGADREAYWAEVERRRSARRAARRASPNTPDVPAAASEIFSAPYVIGPAFVRVVAAERHAGNVTAAIDALLRHPPSSDAEVAWPDRFVPDDNGGEVGGSGGDFRGDFGAVRLRAVLSEHVGDRVAADALAQAWRGDSMTSYRAAGRECVRIRFTVAASWRSAMAGALTTLAARLPDAVVRVRSTGMPTLEACDSA